MRESSGTYMRGTVARPNHRNRIMHKALRDMRRLGHEAFRIDETRNYSHIYARGSTRLRYLFRDAFLLPGGDSA